MTDPQGVHGGMGWAWVSLSIKREANNTCEEGQVSNAKYDMIVGNAPVRPMATLPLVKLCVVTYTHSCRGGTSHCGTT